MKDKDGVDNKDGLRDNGIRNNRNIDNNNKMHSIYI